MGVLIIGIVGIFLIAVVAIWVYCLVTQVNKLNGSYYLVKTGADGIPVETHKIKFNAIKVNYSDTKAKIVVSPSGFEVTDDLGTCTFSLGSSYQLKDGCKLTVVDEDGIKRYK